MRNGLDKFIQSLKDTKYSLGCHAQAEKDYDLVYYELRDMESMADEEICKVLADYGCPYGYDLNTEFNPDMWCDKIPRSPNGYGSDVLEMMKICPRCWKAFLESLE